MKSEKCSRYGSKHSKREGLRPARWKTTVKALVNSWRFWNRDEQSAQEPVEAFVLCGCKGVLEMLQERCDRVFYYCVAPFGCCHSERNLLQAAPFCT